MIEISTDNLRVSGFTLLEMMIAVATGFIVISATCIFYMNQTKTHEDHQMIVEMQQNGRAGVTVLSNELLFAGYSPVDRVDGGVGKLAGIEEAGIHNIKFSYDANGNGKIDKPSYNPNKEQTQYEFKSTEGKILRNGYNNWFMDDVASLSFLYAYDLDDLGATNGGYGVLEKDASKNTIWAFDSDGGGNLDKYYTINESTGDLSNSTKALTPEIPFSRIRAVKVWVLLKSKNSKKTDFSDPTLGDVPQTDGVLDYASDLDSRHAHRLYSTTVKLRNMYY